MKFTVLGKPLGKQRPRFANANGFARAYTPQQTVNYENYIRLCFMQSGGQMVAQGIPLKMTITAVYEIPKAFSKAKRLKANLGQIRPLTKPDIDNIAKVVCDALNKVAYADDNQIITLTVCKFYGDEPKIIIEIEEN